ncbi:MAG: hypothetical protein QOF51_69 [Chloroflexota bacterium]|jgi:hypothetical protein|nr:hypothetical protein [Chloroflexota bacterium]
MSGRARDFGTLLAATAGGGASVTPLQLLQLNNRLPVAKPTAPHSQAAVARVDQKDPAQYQSTAQAKLWGGSSCSAAALTAVLQSRGANVKIDDVLQRMQGGITPEQGLTSRQALLDAAASFGLQARDDVGNLDALQAATQHGEQVLVDVRNQQFPEGHWMVATASSDGGVSLVDSSGYALTSMTKQDFLAAWSGKGIRIAGDLPANASLPGMPSPLPVTPDPLRSSTRDLAMRLTELVGQASTGGADPFSTPQTVTTNPVQAALLNALAEVHQRQAAPSRLSVAANDPGSGSAPAITGATVINSVGQVAGSPPTAANSAPGLLAGAPAGDASPGGLNDHRSGPALQDTTQPGLGGIAGNAGPADLAAASGATPGGAAHSTSAGVNAAALVEQLRDAAQAAARTPGATVRLQLRPEGLGAVNLRVSMGEHGVGIHVSVDNTTTHDLVQATWPQLAAALNLQGVPIENLFLELGGGAFGQNAPGRQDWQQPRPGQQRAADSSRPVANEPTPSISPADRQSRVDYRV